MASQPIAQNLFESEPVPRLVAGRKHGTGEYVFPLPDGRAADDFDKVLLSPKGRLWSWTVQRFRPKSPPYIGPEVFEAFALGYIELPGELIVEARLSGLPVSQWKSGMSVRTTIIPFAVAEDGTTLTTYAFEPDTENGQ